MVLFSIIEPDAPDLNTEFELTVFSVGMEGLSAVADPPSLPVNSIFIGRKHQFEFLV